MKYERLTEREYLNKPKCFNCKHNYSNCSICERYCIDGDYFQLREELKRLVQLEDKIENGTLIELPFKVGDTVYWVFELEENNLEILEGKIRGLSISQNNTSWFSVIYEYGLTFEHIFKDYWNKTVFLTKAEAEKKLKELQGE